MGCQLGLPNKVQYPDFMVRYSICQPKIFSDMKDDPKACANKALLASGMDPENFRTGHTKVMFRAGKLAELEVIRESALTTIIGKMQCHARIAICKLQVYNAKIAEKRHSLVSRETSGCITRVKTGFGTNITRWSKMKLKKLWPSRRKPKGER